MVFLNGRQGPVVSRAWCPFYGEVPLGIPLSSEMPQAWAARRSHDDPGSDVLTEEKGMDKDAIPLYNQLPIKIKGAQ